MSSSDESRQDTPGKWVKEEIGSGKWVTTFEMAVQLGIHSKTLLRLKNAHFTPFEQGWHYRRGGLTTRAPVQWHMARTEEAFTEFHRVNPDSVEGFTRQGLLLKEKSMPSDQPASEMPLVPAIPKRTVMERRTLRIHPDQWQQLEAVAEENGVSISRALRVLLDRALRQEKSEKP
jgi:hypothetical protein